MKKLTKFNTYVVVGNVMGTQGLPAVLGQKGIKIKEFADEFNKLSKAYKPGELVRCTISSEGKGGKFFLEVKYVPTSELVKKALNVKLGSGKAGVNNIGTITMLQIEEIAKAKLNDTNASDLKAAIKTVVGTAKSMGVTVK